MPGKPAVVAGLGPVELVASGEAHTCAVSDGRARCWGRGSGGLIDGNPPPPEPTPIDVGGVEGIISISGGARHTCAALESGEVWCWGSMFPNVEPHGPPQPVPGISDAVGVAGGMIHHCAWTSSGEVYCWGGNPAGQLGTGDDGPTETPVRVEVPPVVHVSSEFLHTCAVTVAGEVYCWGGFAFPNPNPNSPAPGPMPGVSTALRVASGEAHSCAVLESGQVACWGRPDSKGAGTLTPADEPSFVLGLNDAIDIVAGRGHTCALRETGDITCWGENFEGQLGDDVEWLAPIRPELAAPTQVAMGRTHTCALDQAGLAWCWGSNSDGQLSDGTGIDHLDPEPATLLNAVGPGIDLSAGRSTTCLLAIGGDLYCQGLNEYGQLGGAHTDTTSDVVAVDIAAPVLEVASGMRHSCARTAAQVFCWGDTTYNQPDPAAATGIPTALDFGAASTIVKLAAGDWHTCAIDADGGLWCWGENSFGQLGVGDNLPRAEPTLVPFDTAVVAIAAGSLHTCALNAAGLIDCWGNNNSGELGDINVGRTPLPNRIPTLSGIDQLVGGGSFSCAHKTNSDWYCWGSRVGTDGVFDDTAMRTYYDPVVRPALQGLTSMAASTHGLCGMQDGVLTCFGGNFYGQLGSGSSSGWRLLPNAVVGLP